MEAYRCAEATAGEQGIAMSRYAILEEIRRLDPERDHQRIIFLSTCYEFRSTRPARWSSPCSAPSACPASRPCSTGRASSAAAPQKRYDDTDIIVCELIERGYDSERGDARARGG